MNRQRQRFLGAFNGADPRVCIAFWLLGLVNNVLYVIILSAALDLVGPTIPKSVVLLADVIPSFLTKLTAPYFIGQVPYAARIPILIALSSVGMIIISVSPTYLDGGTVSSKIFGIVLASLSSGLGELSFLALTYFYGPFSLAAWGSGTGAAGLIGAGAYALATTTLHLSVKTTLLASSFLPLIMFVSFFVVLPQAPLTAQRKSQGIESDEDEWSGSDAGSVDAETEPAPHDEQSMLMPHPPSSHSTTSTAWARFVNNLDRSSRLFFPFMLPLLLVYVAEYTINQGVAPTLLFPLDESPFNQFRSFYPTYNAVYQLGVFLSRSSTPFFRVHHLYYPSFLQLGNLVLLVLQSLFSFIPSVYVIFLIIFWEGLLGGLVYVNTFAEISERVPAEDREYSLGATTVSDSGGICIAGFVGMAMEMWLCGWQVRHGRDWCTKS